MPHPAVIPPAASESPHGGERPLHVCFVCNELPPASAGGIGPCVLTTARRLAERGHTVTVVGVYDRVYQWNHMGVDVRPIVVDGQRASRARRAVRVATNRLRLRRALAALHRSKPIDIVEWPDFEGLYVSGIPGVVDVVRNHGPIMSHRLYGLVAKRAYIEWLECRTLRMIENWIGVSHWFMDQWLRITGARPRRRTVLYNPVDCEMFKPLDAPGRGDLILYSGSIMERKGVYALARAARIFLERLPQATLLFVGRELDVGGRRRVVEEAGEAVASRIRFSDPLPQHEVARLMRECTVFAMPSLLESFGNVWAEAMASGVPVLGSTLTCGPEVVPHDEAGILVDPSNPPGIAQQVVRLMSDAALRRRLGAAGRRIALARYSTDVVIPSTVRFYLDCLDRPARVERTA